MLKMIRLKNLNSNDYKVKKIGYNHEYDVYASNIILREDSIKFTANVWIMRNMILNYLW